MLRSISCLPKLTTVRAVMVRAAMEKKKHTEGDSQPRKRPRLRYVGQSVEGLQAPGQIKPRYIIVCIACAYSLEGSQLFPSEFLKVPCAAL